jgi:CTP synthase (UTP-ammonia lyase)
MSGRRRVALVGDYNPAAISHRSIPEALRLCGDVDGVWMHTGTLSNAESQLRDFDGIWCVPASPYARMQGALDAIQYAREQRVPFLGTCGGFQHALLEYARNVRGLKAAAHAETDPDAAMLLIAPLACALVEKTDEIVLDGGLIREAYGVARITEGYHCSYGLNCEYESALFGNGFQATARDLAGDVRAVEIETHPFFVLTLFQHERRALRGEAPPLVKAFVAAMSR